MLRSSTERSWLRGLTALWPVRAELAAPQPPPRPPSPPTGELLFVREMQVAALPRWARQLHAREHGEASGPIRVHVYSSAGAGRSAAAAPLAQDEPEAATTAPESALSITAAGGASVKQSLAPVPEAGALLGGEHVPGFAAPSPAGGQAVGRELAALRVRQEQLEAMLRRIASARPSAAPVCLPVLQRDVNESMMGLEWRE